jgi:hypothetical protein
LVPEPLSDHLSGAGNNLLLLRLKNVTPWAGPLEPDTASSKTCGHAALKGETGNWGIGYQEIRTSGSRLSGYQDAGYHLKIDANCKINNAKLALS